MAANHPVRIIIVDDHEVVRLGIRALLEQQTGFQVIAEAESGEEAVAKAIRDLPDVILMDVRLPGMSGVDACRQIMNQLPHTRIIMLTTFAEDDLLFSAIRAGAAGYILKRIGSHELVQTIQAVARGDSAIDPALTSTMFRQVAQGLQQKEEASVSQLSDQELHVLALIAEGLTNREIAARLFLSEGTVRNYVSNVLSKLNLANRAEAAAFAVQHNVKGVDR